MIPNVLYKYRDWRNQNHKKILINNEIFFASPDSLNDPFDCKIPIRYENGDEKKAFKMALRCIEHQHPRYNGETQARLAKELVDHRMWQNPDNIERYKSFQYDYWNQNFGIFSLSGEKDIDLCWSHYSLSHTGFCVGFNKEKLTQEIEGRLFQNNLLIDIQSINYVEDLPCFNGWDGTTDEKIIPILTTKKNTWAYEKEHRLILLNGTNKKVLLNVSVFQNVILGLKMDEKDKNDIIDILKNKENKIPLFQTRRNDENYELSFDEIQY